MKPNRTSERGATLLEVLIVVGLAGALLAVAISYSLDWLGKEEMRSSVYTVRSYLQMARMQAVSRNHECQFRVDSSTKALQVYDINDPLSSTDDVLLWETKLPQRVSFARPDSSTPITLTNVSGTLYQATFGGDGVVTSTVGDISILGGTRYHRIELFTGGGQKIWNWDGATWVAGW